MKYCISPSILSSDFSKLGRTVDTLRKGGVEYIHLDVMDGQFVPNISFGSVVIKDIDPKNKLIKDVHLMVNNPEKQVDALVEAGADIITFHYEACKDNYEITNMIDTVHEKGLKVGIAIKPDTPVSDLRLYLSQIDLVLVMSVEPGKGGQPFNEIAYEKIKELKEFREVNNYSYLIEVDGGVNNKNIYHCKRAGADIMVVGSYLFEDDDLEERLGTL